MQLSLSCRIAEGFLSKEEACLTFEQLADIAVSAGYDAICMRASQIGVQSSAEEVHTARKILDDRHLKVTMISGDFDIVYNNERGPNCLRNIKPYLDLADALDAPLVRVCIKTQADINAAKHAADQAAERGRTLVHQCHNQSLFETVSDIVSKLREIDRPNFALVFEAANLELCRQDYGIITIRELAPWIQNVYLQNQQIHPGGAITLDTWCGGPVSFDTCEIPDPNGIEFGVIFQALKTIGYDGPITVHQSAPQDGKLNSEESAALTATFIKEKWGRDA